MSGIVTAFLDAAISSRLATVVNSIQTGYIQNGTSASGAGEDASYFDVTIAAVNVDKSVINWQPSGATSFMIRFMSGTTLRISSASVGVNPTGRWRVVENK